MRHGPLTLSAFGRSTLGKAGPPSVGQAHGASRSGPPPRIMANRHQGGEALLRGLALQAHRLGVMPLALASSHKRALSRLIFSGILQYAGGSANAIVSAPTSTERVAPMNSNQELVGEFVLSAHGNMERVLELLSQHPDLLNMKWERFDENALEAAGHMGRRDIAGYLLERGAPMTIYSAAMLGREDLVAEYLREDPSLARTPGVHGFSVLYHAALSGNVALAELLLTYGGDNGKDAALHAAISGDHPAMATWLLEHGANANALNFEGKTPLQVARESGWDDLVALLIEHGGTE